MQATFEISHLLPQLAKAVGAANGKARALEILRSVRIEADGSGMAEITGTDLTVAVTVRVPCEGEFSGCVPGDRLLAWARMGAGSLTLRGREGRVTLTEGASRATLPLLAVAEHPVGPVRSGHGALELLAGQFRELLSFVRPAMGKSDVRHYLNGALLECADGVLRAVASDGFRMSHAEMPCACPAEWSLIVPRRGVEALIGLAGGGCETVRLSMADRELIVETADEVMAIQQIDGRYADWRRVAPAGTEAAEGDVGFELREAAAALERVAVMGHQVKLRIEEGGIDLRGEEEAAGRIAASMRDGLQEVVQFHVPYFLEALKAFGAGEMRMRLPEDHDRTRGVVLAQEGRPGWFAIVMPILA